MVPQRFDSRALIGGMNTSKWMRLEQLWLRKRLGSTGSMFHQMDVFGSQFATAAAHESIPTRPVLPSATVELPNWLFRARLRAIGSSSPIRRSMQLTIGYRNVSVILLNTFVTTRSTTTSTFGALRISTPMAIGPTQPITDGSGNHVTTLSMSTRIGRRIVTVTGFGVLRMVGHG